MFAAVDDARVRGHDVEDAVKRDALPAPGRGKGHAVAGGGQGQDDRIRAADRALPVRSPHGGRGEIPSPDGALRKR